MGYLSAERVKEIRTQLKAEFKGQVLNEVQLYKKTVKGQRLARVM